MNEIVKKSLIEIIRILITACLAVIGVESTGCVASGDSSTAAFVTSSNK